MRSWPSGSHAVRSTRTSTDAIGMHCAGGRAPTDRRVMAGPSTGGNAAPWAPAGEQLLGRLRLAGGSFVRLPPRLAKVSKVYLMLINPDNLCYDAVVDPRRNPYTPN